ncbi:hypothetical protein [Bdellovibrio svalbardensis]|uniref:Peptidase M48 domain-containing protein n=1 Tax=Bdellovibrio svalbardensis TaxID=2972972 RepID=A0ABT6DLL8_9BACT|nr:hypothetical protein [Bdellovibrio svalbardensis]MDG0816706.1 hypothetical protein [Bdellovibrio svalbardensis]
MTKSTMIRALSGVALVATLGFTFKSQQVQELCHGFVPENSMYIPEGLYTTGGISQDQFNQVMDRVEKIFTRDVEGFGDKLKINRLWSDGTVNASAQKSGNTRILNMYGGLARHKAIGVEGMALVVCHELGHHNGGAPKSAGWYSTWATNEGGSDYFATSKCLRRFFAEDDNAAIVAGLTIDPTAKAGCESQFSNLQDQLICLRISEAGQQVANLFMDLSGDSKPPKYNTPDKSVVKRTNDAHPATQCRLDTYLAGALCQVRETEVPSDTDYKVASCYTPRDAVGFRPLCWFAPK